MKHNFLSTRASMQTPEDLYKSRGRTKHEWLSVACGPFLHAFSLRDDVAEQDVYNVTILRNARVIGGEPVERRRFVLCRNTGEHDPHGAKKDLIEDFLQNNSTKASLQSQRRVISMLSSIYKSMHGNSPHQNQREDK